MKATISTSMIQAIHFTIIKRKLEHQNHSAVQPCKKLSLLWSNEAETNQPSPNHCHRVDTEFTSSSSSSTRTQPQGVFARSCRPNSFLCWPTTDIQYRTAQMGRRVSKKAERNPGRDILADVTSILKVRYTCTISNSLNGSVLMSSIFCQIIKVH